MYDPLQSPYYSRGWHPHSRSIALEYLTRQDALSVVTAAVLQSLCINCCAAGLRNQQTRAQRVLSIHVPSGTLIRREGAEINRFKIPHTLWPLQAGGYSRTPNSAPWTARSAPARARTTVLHKIPRRYTQADFVWSVSTRIYNDFL